MVISRCWFAGDVYKIYSYKHLQRTCTPTLLLIISFVWRRPRCRWRRGLLKLPKLPEVRPIYFRNQLIAGATDYESSGRMQIILRIAYTTEMSGPHHPFSLCYSGRP